MPPKRRTLKELIRERTSGPDAHKEVTHELFKGSDRSVAILLAADVEGALGELITTVWDVRDKKLADALYGREGPLSTFYMVSTLAMAMRLIDKDQAATLATLRRVRNAFAHARSLVRFTTPEVEAECKKLWAWTTFEGADLQGFSRARAAYIYAAMDLTVKIEQRRAVELEKLREALDRAEIVKALRKGIRPTSK